MKTPPASYLILKALNQQKGSGEPNKVKIGKITKSQLREIAEKKLPDLNCHDVEAGMKIIAGTARNMGVEVEA
jgi:large subunit ribosomal protein L11